MPFPARVMIDLKQMAQNSFDGCFNRLLVSDIVDFCSRDVTEAKFLDQ